MKHGWRASIAGLALALAGCGGDGGGALLGTLERDRIELIAEAQETIVEVAVREGDAVKAGDLVLRLDPSDVQTRVAQARANALEAERLYAQYVAGARIEDVNEARARVAGAAARSKIESRRVRSHPESGHPGPLARECARPATGAAGQCDCG